MYRIKDLVPGRILLCLYYSLIYPYLIYCNPIWSNTYAVHTEQLKILQKRAIRILSNSDYLAHTNPLFFRNRVLKLDDISLYCTCIYVFRNFDVDSSHVTHTHNTRSSHNLRPNFRRLDSSRRSLDFVGPRCWNNLPANLQNINNPHSFKTNLKDYLISTYNSDLK